MEPFSVSSSAHCPHRSVPVEMDESMTCSSLDLVLPPACQQCLCSARTHQQRQQRQHGYQQTQRPGPGDNGFYLESGAAPPGGPLLRPARQNPHPAHLQPRSGGGGGGGGAAGAPGYHQDSSSYSHHGPVEDEDQSLERPLPLVSDSNQGHWVQAQHPAAPPPGHAPMQAAFARPCACCSPADPPRHNKMNNNNRNNHKHGNPEHLQRQPNLPPQPGNVQEAHNRRSPGLQSSAPSCELIQEVSVGVGRSLQPPPGPSTREMKRTINLPDEYRNLFITYSVDAARDMWPFVKFLVDHGFRPVIDLIDDPIRRMAINRWMDRFLNDKSVLIIVAISPRYRAVVEGEVDDDHGLNTKYIYSQIQTEYIQQGSSNFRVVPVLFPNATKHHVPTWLQSTRIYRWRLDDQDLLLRLAREERYIIPPPGRDLTLTIRTL